MFEERLSQPSQQVLRTAHLLAARLNSRQCDTSHVVAAALLRDTKVLTAAVASSPHRTPEQLEKALADAGYDPAAVHTATNRPPAVGQTDDLLAMTKIAFRRALESGGTEIDPVYLVLAVVEAPTSPGACLLEDLHVNLTEFEKRLNRLTPAHAAAVRGNAPLTLGGDDASALATYGRDLVAAANRGEVDPVVGRDIELAQLQRVLARRRKNNPVLVGPAGVGKTAIAEAFAAAIASGEIQGSFASTRVIEISMAQLVAGARLRGDFEERLTEVIEEATADDADVVLFIDEIHTILGAGEASGSLDAANILKPALARGQLRLIGATTVDEYRKIERDPALERRFAPVEVPEPDITTTIEILAGVAKLLSAHHDGVSFVPESYAAAAQLAKRHLPDRHLPDSAIELLDDAAAALSSRAEADVALSTLDTRAEKLRSRIDTAAAQGRRDDVARAERALAALDRARDRVEVPPVVDAAAVAAALSDRLGVEVSADSTDAIRLGSLAGKLAERIIGQDHVTDDIAAALRRHAVGVSSHRRPAASALLAGPPGVGKTATAEALAELVFGDVEAVTTIDCAEYAEEHRVSRLIGAAPGYVGYGKGGVLTEAARRRPHQVIVFEEIELAHPAIHKILLSVLEGARLTDSEGRVADFSHAVVLVTTNLGADGTRRVGFGADASGLDHAREKLTAVLGRPLMSRFDVVGVYEALSAETLRSVADLFAADLADRMRPRGVTLRFAPAALDALCASASSSKRGARDLRTLFEKQISSPLADLLVSQPWPISAPVAVACDDAGAITVTLAEDPVTQETTY